MDRVPIEAVGPNGLWLAWQGDARLHSLFLRDRAARRRQSREIPIGQEAAPGDLHGKFAANPEEAKIQLGGCEARAREIEMPGILALRLSVRNDAGAAPAEQEREANADVLGQFPIRLARRRSLPVVCIPHFHVFS